MSPCRLSKDSSDRALLCLTREQVTRLTRLAEDLADVRALDRHALQSKAEPVTISDLLEDIAAALSAAAGATEGLDRHAEPAQPDKPPPGW